MAKRRAVLKRRPTNVEPTTMFIVACEGEATEKIYFEFIQRLIEEVNPDFKFRVKPLPIGSGPQGVLGKMDQYVENNGITREDHSWLVMDVDHHTHGHNLQIMNAVIQTAASRSRKYRIALSNACFEVWLILHLTDSLGIIPSTQMERETQRNWPAYDKSNYDANTLRDGINKAIQRAKRRDTTPEAAIPEQSGTRVYQLMETLRVCIEQAGGTSPF